MVKFAKMMGLILAASVGAVAVIAVAKHVAPTTTKKLLNE